LIVLLVAIVVAALSSRPGSYIAHAPRELPSSLWITR
jgi:hypothetical protein